MGESLVIFLVVTLIGLSGAQVIEDGICDESVPVANNFQLEEFSGIWYEISRTPNEHQAGDCSFFNFTATEASIDELAVHSVIINNNFFEEYNGTIRVAEEGTAKLILDLEIFGKEIDYWVLMSVPTVFSLVYSCENILQEDETYKRSMNFWKLGRDSSYTNDELTHAVMDRLIEATFGINATEVMYNIDHADDACYVLPELEEGQPIVLPGTCDDDDIPVVQNFNFEAFAGLWHSIASYDTPDEDGGACVNSHFTHYSADHIVAVNTWVINETLHSQNSSIRAENGTFFYTQDTEGGPIEREIWILDTDYTSFAITYSCDDIGENERQIHTQIMGRRRELTPDVRQDVDEVIDSVVVLNHRYYNFMDQSDEACFYYPEPVEDQPVVFTGQCDMTVSNVNGFDINRFSGLLWHEIEGYPSTQQQGTCNNVRYSIDNDVISYHTTQVIDERLDEIIGSATLADGVFVTDLGDGRMLNTWVLATDYDSFALIYSCANLNPDQRGVWSWKLSRTKELPPEAHAPIDAAINEIPVLDQMYYEDKDQSRTSCFFYPLPEEGRHVVFPGQCDDDFPIVTSFNIDGFAGVWHEIESYPKTQQPGECITYQFSTGASNMNLQGSEIRDQLLHESDGTMEFTSEDNSATFTAHVTIDGVDMTLPFSIIGTDYDSYALGYSCINLNEDWREIFSWKLSRERSLSASANDAIDALMSDVVVLNDTYFETVSHTPRDCFYFPDLEPGEPVVVVGQCDEDLPVLHDFDVERYSGLWHLISSYPDDYQEGTCNDLTYTSTDDSVIEVRSTHVSNDQRLQVLSGTATPVGNDGSAKFVLSYPGREDQPFWILDTNYDSYSFAYGCQNINTEQRRIWSWVLSKRKSLSEEDRAAIDDVIDSVEVLNHRYYQDVDNSDESCFYFPEPDEQSPTVFRGQCDLNIPVVPNFNAERYSGLWHDIEGYTSVFQTGTCNNALYTLNDDGTMTVQNTQVINQILESVAGVATVVSEDGSAKLEVTFPVGDTNENVSTSYWVLDTDYDNYALVYTCENIDDDHRAVWSWKLSKTKELSEGSNTAINGVINSIQVLDQMYYNIRDQSRDGCFYYPAPNPEEPVIFPGQCDETMPGVEDFNLERFQGIWHEVEAYPVTVGKCNNVNLRVTTNNALDLFTNRIIDDRLSTISGSATTDGSSIFTITINNDGVITTLPCWIIATDYDDYALAYSCTNLNSDYRQVWSWKLGRSKELSNEANIAINEAMTSVQVLENDYFESNDQTDDACFYYPELSPNEPVTFFGQCDETISVVQDFDPERYTGLWYEIESYYDELQAGDCQDTNFSYTENGVFEVGNSQVLDQTLDTITGSAILDSDGSAKLHVTLTRDATNETITSTYWILSTDYDSYSLVYSCENLTPERRQVKSWKLSRTKELRNDAREIIDDVVDSIRVLNDEYYNVRDQSIDACFYYPEYVPGQPITFRGQCDETISVVQDFNIDRYLGEWHDVGSYPQLFQQGTCPKANYSVIDDSTIQVVNTQVVSQELDSITGVARPASDDGSAKLVVTFPVSGDQAVDSDYWVLATDYDNYALVYSCRNISPDRRSVSSWKLSRDQVLSPEHEAAIDAVIGPVQVLRQDYYEYRGQSEEDCFFYPDNEGGPVILDGQCDADSDVPVVEDFDSAQFAGVWHEVSRFPSELQTGECSNAEIDLVGDSGAFTVTLVHEERLSSVTGQILTDDPRGILRVSFPDNIELTLYVLDTKYDDFALLYGCRNIDEGSKQVYSWKVSRTRDGLSEEANERIDAIVRDKVDLFEGYYQETDQSHYGCFYYPTFVDPPFIQLPGPCNGSVAGKPDFDIAAFAGRWFEASRYPTELQTGQCARIHYSTVGPISDVLATSVHDLHLLSAEGRAHASTEHDATFSVTFEVNGGSEVLEYRVIETDYNNFALVYSCLDLPNGDRRVSSWKLSRERNWDSQYDDILAPIMEDTQGLLQDYYITTDQSDEACFYIPDHRPDEAVVFRGQCDETVPVVENFDIERYLGWWHEIESFPTGSNAGECISSQFEGTSGSYVFVNTHVHGLEGEVTVGEVTVVSPGKLRKTFSDGHSIDLWILATDYETYSLLYSCENINEEYRRVWSAKHSKTRSLTATALAIMQPFIETNAVLYDQFYMNVDQSEPTCFHYPQQTGPFVIIPGQCDGTIPVIQGFDLVRYIGDWFEIERYPHIHETGYCMGARYELDDSDDVIKVTNWQVVDGELETIEGTGSISSSDNSGRLTLTLPVPGGNGTSTTEAYILASDYASFSLVYTCQNLPNGFQRYVGAWKLSRTRSLPAAAVTAINNVMSQREELHQPYFLTTRQEESCPVPLSSHLVKSASLLLFLSLFIQLFM